MAGKEVRDGVVIRVAMGADIRYGRVNDILKRLQQATIACCSRTPPLRSGTTQDFPAQMASNPPSLDCYQFFPCLTFFFPSPEQYLPAALLRLLFLIAGIEPNPGPKPPRFPCTACSKSACYSSVQCSRCRNWVHIRCTQLKSAADYCQSTFLCPPCLPPLNLSTSPPPHFLFPLLLFLPLPYLSTPLHLLSPLAFPLSPHFLPFYPPPLTPSISTPLLPPFLLLFPLYLPVFLLSPILQSLLPFSRHNHSSKFLLNPFILLLYPHPLLYLFPLLLLYTSYN